MTPGHALHLPFCVYMIPGHSEFLTVFLPGLRVINLSIGAYDAIPAVALHGCCIHWI